jgi:hypothetical protein
LVILERARSAAVRALLELVEARIAVRAAQAAVSHLDLPAMPGRECVVGLEVPSANVAKTRAPQGGGEEGLPEHATRKPLRTRSVIGHEIT